jgi:multidrug transporter EmrE-like cation transporter
MKNFYTWLGVLLIVISSSAGDCLLARAMKQIGDLDDLCKRRGIPHSIVRVLQNPSFMLGISSMTLGFFSLLFALSWGDVSLVGPASASLTFVANAFAAKLFLHERVDHRRWTAALLVAGGVFLLAG